jgi:hypothetical protein
MSTTYRKEDLLQEREWLQHKLYDLQSSKGLAALQDALEIKKHIEDINAKLNAVNNDTSNKEV